MTVVTSTRPTTPIAIQRTRAALLLIGPLLMFIGGTLLVRYNDQDLDGVLTQMAAHHGRSDAGWLLMLVGAALVVPGTLALCGLLASTRPRAAAVTTVATTLGWAFATAFSMAALVMAQLAESPQRDAQLDVMRSVNSGSPSALFLLAAIGAVGYVTLAIGLARARLVPRGAAILVGIGGASTLLVVPGPVRALLLLTVALLLAGHTWILHAMQTDRSQSGASSTPSI